ncbi:hypothetical protein [Paenibacillus sp. NPDC057934]|uniref:hypothetical protein n=1 Tax=Paenibacillus sp. NPDC057934 TaxID=3346282 RepID=UPI0036DE79F3
MKKFISGIIVGVLLFVGVTAFADSSSLIGQKVQGLFLIEKGGAKVADAVIIKGLAYAPVRAVAEATGASLTVEGKKIIMEDKPTTSVSEPASVDSGSIDELKASREKLVDAIKQKEFNIKDLENTIGIYESMAKEMENNGDLGKRASDSAGEYKKLVEQRKAELVDLKKQLADIESKIAEVQK